MIINQNVVRVICISDAICVIANLPADSHSHFYLLLLTSWRLSLWLLVASLLFELVLFILCIFMYLENPQINRLSLSLSLSHTCIHADMRACVHECMRTCMHACACIHAYIHTYIYTYIHTVLCLHVRFYASTCKKVYETNMWMITNVHFLWKKSLSSPQSSLLVSLSHVKNQCQYS